MFRVAGMHAPGDNELVFEYPEHSIASSGMTKLHLVSAAGLLQKAPDERFTKLTIHPHATPNGSRIEMSPVVGGGAPCGG
jgi:hypothetical protein